MQAAKQVCMTLQSQRIDNNEAISIMPITLARYFLSVLFAMSLTFMLFYTMQYLIARADRTLDNT